MRKSEQIYLQTWRYCYTTVISIQITQ